MKSNHLKVAALLAAAIALPLFAQPGPGGGPGPGPMGGAGMGPGKGHQFAFNKDNTPGWALMTPEERTANQQKMRSFKTYDECKAFQTEHHAAMEARAKEQGKTLPAPRNNACDRMKAKGLLK